MGPFPRSGQRLFARKAESNDARGLSGSHVPLRAGGKRKTQSFDLSDASASGTGQDLKGEENFAVIEKEFRYLVPASIEEAVGLRREFDGHSRFVSGGTEVVPMMTQGRLKETCLIELSRLKELSAITEREFCHDIGASVTLARLQDSPLVRVHWHALAEAAASIREPQVRNRGTIGGNVSHGVPSADLLPPLLVFEAQIGLAGKGGRRWMALPEFLLGPYRTALRNDELVADIRLPLPATRTGSAFLKVTKYGGSGLSVATAAAALSMEDGRIVRARLAIGSAGPVARCVPEAEAFLAGKAPTDAVLAEAGKMASDAADPRDGSIRASPAHRRRVLVALAARAIALAAQRSAEPQTGASQ